jgi:hypothetical protein
MRCPNNTSLDCQPHVQLLIWTDKIFLSVWVITFDISGMGGPASKKRCRQHSLQDHLNTQAVPLRKRMESFGWVCMYKYLYNMYYIYIYVVLSKIFRTDSVKTIKLIRPIGRHHPRRSSISHVDTIFGTLP